MIEGSEEFLERLNNLGTGERAALKREAGTMIYNADGAALRAFYRCVPSSISSSEDKWFAVACLRCLWDTGDGNGKPLEEVISFLINNNELSESASHRVSTLLDTRWDQDGFMLSKLVRIIKLIRQKSNVLIDHAQLLEDLVYWNSDSQSVQRQWARSIFGYTKAEKIEKE